MLEEKSSVMLNTIQKGRATVDSRCMHAARVLVGNSSTDCYM